jgi:hypothetical protein
MNSLRNLMKLEPRHRSDELNAAILRTLLFSPAVSMFQQIPSIVWPRFACNSMLKSAPPGAVIVGQGDTCQIWSIVLSGSVSRLDNMFQNAFSTSSPKDASSGRRPTIRYADVSLDVAEARLFPGDSFGHNAILDQLCDDNECQVCANVRCSHPVFV